MRRFCAVVSLLTLTGAACGGGGGGGAATTVDTVVAVTDAPTTTTEAPTTTAPPQPLTEDVTLAGWVATPAGYTYAPATNDALGDFAVLTEDQQHLGDTMDRYTLLAVAKDGAPVGNLLVLWMNPSLQATPSAEVEDDVLRSLRNAAGLNGADSDIAIERGVTGTKASVAWSGFFHNGVTYVAWGGTKDSVDAYMRALVLAIHMQAPFGTVEQMEGDLALMYVPLLPPCEFNQMPNYLMSKRDMIKAGNSWREDETLLAQHFAVRQVKCPPAQGELVITEFPVEFVGNHWGASLMAGYMGDTLKETWTISDIIVALDKEGSVRWVQGHYFFQLFSDVLVANNRQVFGTDSLKAIATQMIDSGIALKR